MCYGCWEEAGKPQIDTETVRALVPLLREADPYGALHIVVEDWNLEDVHLDHCATHPDLTDLDREIIRLMRASSLDERASAMAFADHLVEFTPAPQ